MIGKTLGHYRVGEQLGRGGMGEVYMADDHNLNRKVALKFLPDVFTGDPERMARFEREAKLLASLNHPNIAAIRRLEQAEGKRFPVLELVEGETLVQRLSKGRFLILQQNPACHKIFFDLVSPCSCHITFLSETGGNPIKGFERKFSSFHLSVGNRSPSQT